MNTIDDLLKLLEAAKKEFGGEFPYRIYNRDGDDIFVSRWNIVSLSRGNKIWEELELVE